MKKTIKLSERKLKEIIQESIDRVLNKNLMLEMATFGTERWGNDTYKIAVHGASTNDRPTPHIHIYLNNDVPPFKLFNFEISFEDIVSKDEINLIYQLDRHKHVKNTNSTECSWTGYADIYEGFKNFLFSAPTKTKFGTFKDNLERAIYEWNRETDFVKTEQGGNPMKEYFDEKGVVVLPKYLGYFG